MRNTEYLIGLDLGTTTCKAIALSEDGKILATSTGSYEMRSPRQGWVEQDPEQIWYAVSRSLSDLTTKLNGTHAIALSFSGAMHNLLPVDSDGLPLSPAMIWADTRAVDEARILSEETDAHELYRRTGCPVRPIYHPARLRWIGANAPELMLRASRFTSLKDWIVFKITGVWAADAGLASTTGLLNIHSLKWDDEALALARIEAERLPELVSIRAVAGGMKEDIARSMKLPAGLPVISGSSDGGLAIIGAGSIRDGQVVITVGTSGAVRKLTNAPLLDALERTWCYVLDERKWYAGGAINNGGLAIQWVRERLYCDLPDDHAYQQLMEEAEQVPLGANGIMALPYFTGERSPHWNPNARRLRGLSLTLIRTCSGRSSVSALTRRCASTTSARQRKAGRWR